MSDLSTVLTVTLWVYALEEFSSQGFNATLTDAAFRNIL
jgi:hypothetical protein